MSSKFYESWRERAEVRRALSRLAAARESIGALSLGACLLGDGQRCGCPTCVARSYMAALNESIRALLARTEGG